MRTRHTPPAMALLPAASLGSMPPAMVPPSTSPAISAVEIWPITSPRRSSTPGTSERKVSSSAPSATATAAAAVSALTLSSANGLTTGTAPAASSSVMAATSTLLTVPTNPSRVSNYRGGGQRTDYAGRLNPRLPQECDKVCVLQFEHLTNDLEHRFGGDPAAVDELGLQSALAAGGRDLRPAAVHDHDVVAGGPQALHVGHR